jgi:O-antigen/teichoic acid export membrane protein
MTREPEALLKTTATQREIRGSTLFLVGRVLLVGLNFVTQVLIVRYLSKADYGAFAYALVVAMNVESIITLGLDRVDKQFMAAYDEQRDYARLAGTITLVLGSVVSLGLAAALLLYGLQDWVAESVITEKQVVPILVILILLAPIQAVDNLTMSLFGVFARPRAVFFRRYVLNPGLRLAVVILLIAAESGVTFLAVGYVATGVFGVLLYATMLLRLFRDMQLLGYFRPERIKVPFRKVFGYALPLTTTDLGAVLSQTLGVFLIGLYYGTPEVAALRAVVPTAHLNLLVVRSFTFLYAPNAAREVVRGARASIRDLYWQTAIWIAVFSFPIFAVTFSLAEPLTVALFGERYRESAPLLALLALGYYMSSACGFNGITLQVFGKVRFLVITNLAASAVNVILFLLLIPPYGALGAAIGMSATLIFQNVVKQAGLRVHTGVEIFDRRYLRVYLGVVASALGLWLIQLTMGPPTVVGLALTGLISALLLAVSRNLLRVTDTFPELRRIPFARRLFPAPATEGA